MDRRLALVAILVCVALSAAACAVPRRSPSTSRPTEPQATSSEAILGVRLPTTAAELKTRFGKWDLVDLPTDEELSTTPDGQWFMWKSRTTTLSALNEEYSRSISSTSPIGYVQLNSDIKSPEDAGVFGLTFNRSTREDLRKQFGPSLLPCTGRFSGGSAFMTRDGERMWFFFFSGERLTGVAYGFNLDSAG